MARLIFLATLALAGCQSAATFCDLAEPLPFSDPTIDAMTDEEARRVLKHQRTGEKACGWTP